MAKRLLIDSTILVPQLIEDASDKDRLVLRGKFASAVNSTKNKRLYGAKLWEHNIQRLAPKMSQKAIYGELDHPGDGKTKFQRVSHFLTGLKIESNGDVIGEIEVIKGTPNGKIIDSIIKQGGKIAVSSRGFGEVDDVADSVGNFRVKEEGYILETFDVVTDPAVEDAYPTVFYEDVYKPDCACNITNIEDIKTLFPSLYESIANKDDTEKSLDKSVVNDILVAIDKKREELKEEIRNDKGFVDAKSVLSNIALTLKPFLVEGEDKTLLEENEQLRKEKIYFNKEIASLKSENDTLVKKQFLNEMLDGDPCGSIIKGLIDYRFFENTDDMQKRISIIREDLNNHGVASFDSSYIDNLITESNNAISALNKKVVELQENIDSCVKKEEHYESAMAEKDSIIENFTVSYNQDVQSLSDKLDEIEKKSKKTENELIEAIEKNKKLTNEIKRLELSIYIEQQISDRSDREGIREQFGHCTSKREVDSLLENMPKRKNLMFENLRNKITAKTRVVTTEFEDKGKSNDSGLDPLLEDDIEQLGLDKEILFNS